MTQKRPLSAECADFDDVGKHEHGAPLLRNGRLQAGWREASFLRRPDVYSIKARHVVVASHRYAVAGGMVTAAAACSPTQIAIDSSLLEDAAEVHPNGRCRRPGCRELFAQVFNGSAETGAAT
ncbi:hypothetical protein SNOUR_05585 [Streptomyces noursei ATCC 11455]|uniref:hypothetical protein n=1 Tax=Streptomyces noursei TaxID=1971 RepID=UPI00081C575C|nr:hypothetical protein SNOUR_05585 [Streptomyces noursei ATCC 11455]